MLNKRWCSTKNAGIHILVILLQFILLLIDYIWTGIIVYLWKWNCYWKVSSENNTFKMFKIFPLSIFLEIYLFCSYIEMYLRPPSAREEAKISEWIKVRQSGIKYYLSLGDQRIVDKNFIIRPKAEFEVCHFVLNLYVLCVFSWPPSFFVRLIS